MDAVSLISAVDLLPTFCEIAGAKLPSDYQPDGVSQLATLKGQTYPSRTKPLFWKYPSRWPASRSNPDHWVSFAVVDRTWKLVTNYDLSYVELYDIASDPYEKNDLKGQHPEIVKQLHNELEAWQKTLPAKPVGDVFSAERNSPSNANKSKRDNNE